MKRQQTFMVLTVLQESSNGQHRELTLCLVLIHNFVLSPSCMQVTTQSKNLSATLSQHGIK